MKHLSIANRRSLAAALALALLLCAAAATAEPIPELVYPELTGSLDVRAQAIRTVAPDTVVFSIGATAQRATESETLGEVNTVIAAAITALTGLGIDESQIVTSRLNMSPRYSSSFGSSRRISGYSATITLTITLTDFDLIGPAIDAAVAQGANEIGGMRFSFSQDGLAYQQALTDAITVAREKAQAMADAAGVQLGLLLNLRETSGNLHPYANTVFRESNDMYDMSAPMAAAPMQVLPDDIEIQASVEMTYETLRVN